MDIETTEVLGNNLQGVLTKEVVPFYQPRHWQNTDVNRRVLIDFF